MGSYLAAVLLFLAHVSSRAHCTAGARAPAGVGSESQRPSLLLVVGSLNMDLVLDVARLPTRGETLTARRPAPATAVGGKGANQAVAAARLLRRGSAAGGAGGDAEPPSPQSEGSDGSARGGSGGVRFVCRFGNDAYSAQLEEALVEQGVDVSGCERVQVASGLGVVLLEPDGAASSVVLGGANLAFERAAAEEYAPLLRNVGAVLLQREIPEHVNEAVAAAAAAAGVPILLDVGGEDRPISDALLRLLGYVCPNESELGRLTGMPVASEAEALAAAASLLRRGARSVLVTLAERGALLVEGGARESGEAEAGSGPGHRPPLPPGVARVWRQPALPVPGGVVVDATAAGDAFRAAFAVALVEGRGVEAALRFAAAAGALAVSRLGAVPSLPTREEVDALLSSLKGEAPAPVPEPAGAAAGGDGGSGSCTSITALGQAPPPTQAAAAAAAAPAGAGAPPPCPYQFASRLNSMRARRDLAAPSDGGDDVLGWIRRQGRVEGLSLVDLNHPQHTQGRAAEELRAALAAAGLGAGAVCIRFPEARFALGALSHPDPDTRAAAVALAADGCRWAAELGARDLIVWPQFDGYDYHFQADYTGAWGRMVSAYQQLADACPPGVRVSLEFKPTDETTRFSFVPTTASALLLARDVGRPNFGLTLDFGHLLLAGENPAQSLAAVAAEGRLFGLQLNDAHVRLGAEDGLVFGSVNPVAALELVRWLQRAGFEGHIYFDTFPRQEDPVREAELNIRRFKALWARAGRLAAAGIDGFAAAHDALGALELLEAEERGELQEVG